MKTFITTTLFLLLAFNINAQMSLSEPSPLENLYKNMKYMQYKSAPVIEKKHPTYYGAAVVLFSTFLINEAIIRNAENKGSFEHTTKRAGTVYAAGATLTIGICILENRKHNYHYFKRKKNGNNKGEKIQSVQSIQKF